MDAPNRMELGGIVLMNKSGRTFPESHSVFKIYNGGRC
jgi:hypothetical protein